MQGEGYCECGCGGLAPIAKMTNSRLGHVKGQPARFIQSHNLRKNGPRFRLESRGYETPCWIWQLHRDNGGYGVVSVGGKLKKAHRATYEAHVGPIVEDLELDHLCRVRECVNPAHLEPVTRTTNVRRSALAKLDERKAQEIRALLAGGWRGTDVARAYGVSFGLVYQVRDGIAWKDVA